MVLKLYKKVLFLQLCADLSKKSNSVKEICIYTFESSHRTAHRTFLESRHPEVTKNPYDVLYHEASQEKVSAHGLNGPVNHNKIA